MSGSALLSSPLLAEGHGGGIEAGGIVVVVEPEKVSVQGGHIAEGAAAVTPMQPGELDVTVNIEVTFGLG